MIRMDVRREDFGRTSVKTLVPVRGKKRREGVTTVVWKERFTLRVNDNEISTWVLTDEFGKPGNLTSRIRTNRRKAWKRLMERAWDLGVEVWL